MDGIPESIATGNAEVVKLVDALASGASRGNPVEVQVLSSAPLYVIVLTGFFKTGV